MALGKKTGGRKKGSVNKDKPDVEGIARETGCDPFKILCLFANGDWEALGYDSSVYIKEGKEGSTTIGYTITPEARVNAAKEAAKYLYSQKKAIEHTTGDDGFKVIIEDYRMIRKLP